MPLLFVADRTSAEELDDNATLVWHPSIGKKLGHRLAGKLFQSHYHYHLRDSILVRFLPLDEAIASRAKEPMGGLSNGSIFDTASPNLLNQGGRKVPFHI